ncbi:MAG: photosynthetic reaction center subunit H, partial [Pseudomonadota bacterium]
FEPTGDPMADGVGPAAWCNRRDEPELDGHGHAKIVPMRVAEDFAILDGQRDPRGMPVIGGDGEQAGTISDVWIDKPEMMIRFLEIELTGGDRVLAPMTLAWIKRDSVKINALYAAQFPGIPRTKSPDQVTLLEEEKIAAYYCGGKLYADTNRQEPLL